MAVRLQRDWTGARAAQRSARPLRGIVALLLAAILLATLVGCAHFKAPWAKPVTGDIQGQRQQINQLVAYRRMADLADVVADEVQVIAPSGVINGRKNLARSYESLVRKRPDLVQIFTPERVELNPRWKFAAERGHWSESWQEQGEVTEVHGSYYALWKFRDGHWRLYSQIVTPVSCKGASYCKTME